MVKRLSTGAPTAVSLYWKYQCLRPNMTFQSEYLNKIVSSNILQTGSYAAYYCVQNITRFWLAESSAVQV